METDIGHLQSTKIAPQKVISNKKNLIFEKIEKNANDSKELWKSLKPLRMKLGKSESIKIYLVKRKCYSIRT